MVRRLAHNQITTAKIRRDHFTEGINISFCDRGQWHDSSGMNNYVHTAEGRLRFSEEIGQLFNHFGQIEAGLRRNLDLVARWFNRAAEDRLAHVYGP